MKKPLPTHIEDKFVETAAEFARKTGAKIEDIQVFIVEILKIYNELLDYREVN